MTSSTKCPDAAHAGIPSAAAHTLHIDKAGSGWGLLLQSGARVACTTGIALSVLLRDELALPPDKLKRIDVLMLDGKPVDDPENTVVPDGSRLALAAGLPGIAGLAMKSNSALRGLRPGITHRQEEAAPSPGPGHLEIALFSLALPLLAMHLLLPGLFIPAGRLARHMRPALGGDCFLDGRPVAVEEARRALLALPDGELVRFSAKEDKSG